jgi:hypothetical protein
MGIPDPRHTCWLRLASPQAAGFVPKKLALQLLFTRLSHETMPASAKAEAIYTFFVKYEKILSWELNELQRLHFI